MSDNDWKKKAYNKNTNVIGVTLKAVYKTMSVPSASTRSRTRTKRTRTRTTRTQTYYHTKSFSKWAVGSMYSSSLIVLFNLRQSNVALWIQPVARSCTGVNLDSDVWMCLDTHNTTLVKSQFLIQLTYVFVYIIYESLFVTSNKKWQGIIIRIRSNWPWTRIS